MKYSETSVCHAQEVLKRMLGAEYLKPITISDDAFEQMALSSIVDRVPAGTAVTADGDISKGDGSDVYGILLNDVFVENPNGSVIVASAVINSDNSTATSDDRTALASKVVLFE